MSRVEVFSPEHLEQIELRPIEAEKLRLDPKAVVKMANLAIYGSAGALIHDELIIGLFGYYELWPGCYEIWALPSIHVDRFRVLYLRTVKRYINALGETLKPRRLQTTSHDDPVHTRWMRFLGFTNETPGGMLRYSVLDETFNLWAKVYEVTG